MIQVSSFAKIEAHANTSPIKGRHPRLRDNAADQSWPRIEGNPYHRRDFLCLSRPWDEAKALAAGRNAYVTKPYLASDVRFGSLAVIAAALPNVRFTPNGRTSGVDRVHTLVICRRVARGQQLVQADAQGFLDHHLRRPLLDLAAHLVGGKRHLRRECAHHLAAADGESGFMSSLTLSSMALAACLFFTFST